MIAFGPVPSRRLGSSLGINHIVHKACSYACAYCQVGPTPTPEIEPRVFYEPQVVIDEVVARVRQVTSRGDQIDRLTCVPDGEPTLDVNLGRLIEGLAPLAIPVAVITNGTLLWRDEVRARLAAADLVSLKVDSMDVDVWRRINRPHASLDLARVHEGRKRLAAAFAGDLITETMLLAHLGDGEDELSRTADAVAELQPKVAYLSIPTRPGATSGARRPQAEAIARAYAIFSERIARVEVLAGDEGVRFGATGDAAGDILGTTAVHPMREDQLRALLARDGATWSVVEGLLDDGRLVRVEHEGRAFFARVH